MKRMRIVDSHTAGEPTRVVVEGGPDLGHGPLAERLERFRSQYDHYRSGIVNEPRGSDVIVGALLCQPVDPACAAGVIFFNNVGYIGMCGHGSIGLAVTAVWGRMTFQRSWRGWVSRHLIAAWLGDERYRRIDLWNGEHQNAEQE